MKITLRLVPTLLTLLALTAAGPKAQAVVPPPDGGYPGGNTAEGQNALFSRTTGGFNTAVGWLSLRSDTTGSFNTGVGAGTLFANTADSNTAIGAAALLSNTTGLQNTANGVFALFSNTTGSNNTAIGAGAFFNLTSGSGNIALGPGAGNGVTVADDVICIDALGANVNNSCYIGNIYSNVQPVVGTDPDYVSISSSGRLGRANFSSRRYKHDIQPMDKGSEVLFALKPVSFRYNKQFDPTQTLAFGLIAEEVAEVAPDLVGRNPEGAPESVRYEQINAMLLNEFLKEHRKVEKLEAALEAVKAQLKEHDAKIQDVSERLEINTSAARTVASGQ